MVNKKLEISIYIQMKEREREKDFYYQLLLANDIRIGRDL